MHNKEVNLILIKSTLLKLHSMRFNKYLSISRPTSLLAFSYSTTQISTLVNYAPFIYYASNENLGRKKLVVYDESTEEILLKYFNLEIGTKEAKSLLGLSVNTKTSWYKLLDIYKKKYNVSNSFKNNIDLLSSQKRKHELRCQNNNLKKVEYNEHTESALNEYFSKNIGFKDCCKKIGISTKSKNTWLRLLDYYSIKNTIPSNFSNNIDIVNIQPQRIKTTRDNIKKKRQHK